MALQQYCRAGRLDALLLTANKREFSAALSRLSNLHGQGQPLDVANFGTNTPWFGKIGDVSVAVLWTELVSHSMHSAVADALSSLIPLAIISVGVGWGNSFAHPDSRVGDVMESGMIVEFAVNAKVDAAGEMFSRSEVPASTV